MRARTRERDWWLRVLLVLQSPRPVFAALRDDSDEAAQARQEPLVAVVFLAGIAGVLATSLAGRLLDERPDFDAIVIALWAVMGGGVHALVLYFVAGALVFAGAYAAGGAGSYRRARHLLGYAIVPLALSLVLWPVRLALYGKDLFRAGGSDTGAGDALFEAAFASAVGWAVLLLAIGVHTVHAWSWPRALAATALPAAAPVLALARAYGLV